MAEISEKKEVRIQGIRVTGAFLDGSGYGEGARNWILGLFRAGVPMLLRPVSFEQDRPSLDETIEFQGRTIPIIDVLEGLSDNRQQCDINFVRLSPEIAVNFIDPGMINICSCAWETTKLDPLWVECCNKFDAVFVESQWLIEVFKSSGVKTSLYCVPNIGYPDKFKLKSEPNLEKTYRFYSIQQWIERKNGLGLLKSYFNAFSAKDDVLLVLKTYVTRVKNDINQHDVIATDIDELKKSLNLKKDYPPVYLITEKLSSPEIIRMHEDCDCYVLLDRGEGFGLPFMDAAAASNPIIRTDFGGSGEFLNKNNSYNVRCQPTFVCNMSWNKFYNGEQLWAEPDLVHASSLMRYVFEHRAEAFKKGEMARKYISKKFNSDEITKRLLAAISDVVAHKRSL